MLVPVESPPEVAVLLGVLSIVLFNVTSRQFQPEHLFTTCQES